MTLSRQYCNFTSKFINNINYNAKILLKYYYPYPNSSKANCCLQRLRIRAKPDVVLRAILRCNVAILMCKLLGAHWSNFTLVFNVYYKIKGKFVPQACNICIFNFQINSKRHLACKPIGKRVCLQL